MMLIEEVYENIMILNSFEHHINKNHELNQYYIYYSYAQYNILVHGWKES
jgi:hypothetical protein